MNDRAYQLRATLPDLADRTHAQLLELFSATTADRAYIAAKAVSEVYAALVRLGSELDAKARREEAA